jgi:hypothetical protein
MTLRTPAGAVLWECWRLSRAAIATTLIVATVLSALLLAGFAGSEASAVFTLLILIIAALSTQNWVWRADDRNGFTLASGFTRPVRTWMMVVVPMLYIALTSALVYLLPAAALGYLFDLRLPIVPLAASVAAIALSIRASQWWTAHTPTRIAGRLGIGALIVVWLLFEGGDGLLEPDRWSETATIPAAGYLRMVLLATVALVLTVYGVSRQRRGEDLVMELLAARRAESRPREETRFATWLRPGCPTSSPARAQLWYEAHAVGMPILLSGVAGAVVLVLLIMLSPLAGSSDLARGRLTGLAMWALIAPLLIAARRAIGLRRKQGRVFLSVFDGVRPMTSARLVAIRLAVASTALLAAWGVVLLVGLAALAVAPRGESVLEVLGAAVGAWTVVGVLAGAALFVVHLAGTLAIWAGFNAGLVRRKRSMAFAAAGAAAYVAGLIYASYRGWIGGSMIPMNLWMIVVVTAIGTGIALYRSRSRRLLSDRVLAVVGLAWVAFAALHLARFPSIEILNPGDAALGVPLAVFAVILPLAGATWALSSFDRLRHG